MQIEKQYIDLEENPFKHLFARIKVAWRVFIAKKALVFTENNIDVFNMDEYEIIAISSQIVSEMSEHVFTDMKQDIAIKNLVYGN
jgi:Fe-S cluster biosynthesis and repair protein YggX